ncbi:MAG: YkvA family protein [Parvibaculaceae bacterium]
MVLTSNEQKVRTGFWPKLANVFASIPFAEDAVAAYYCAFDRATPLKVKGVLLGALAYFVLPLDAIPDFLLGLGFTDDMAVLLTAISMIRSHLRSEHYDRARATLDRLKRGETLVD